MKKGFLATAALVMLMIVSSCVKERYDAPPTGGTDPDLKANITIDSLKARFRGSPVQIGEDLIVSAIVTADDKNGNFYKTIVVQDSTGGISLLLDGTSLFTEYPVGRRLFIKCRGLWLGDYNGLIQMGGYLDYDNEVAEIQSAVFDKYIIKGSYYHPVVPKAVTINQLNDSYQNVLVELNNVEFVTADAGKPFADGYNKNSLNRTIKNCQGADMLVRTSGFASFANTATPTGNGKLVAVYTVFGNDGQLVIRDLKDLDMDSTRCGGGTVVTGNGIRGITSAWSGSNFTIPAGKTISGIVISDKANGNVNSSNMIIQDSTGGVVVRFSSSASNTYALGDQVTVNAGGLEVTSFNGVLQINSVPSSAVSKTGTGTITPRVVTTADIAANYLDWQSTLLTIQNASLSGGTNYYSGTSSGATRTITDGQGTVALYTLSSASFASTPMPSGNKTITGVLSQFNSTPQLTLRSAADVQ